MTHKQFRALAAYVREVMDVVGLAHWKLIIMRDRPDAAGPNAEGWCSPLFGQHTARMWFDPDLAQQLPARSRYVVIHEVMHIHLHAPWQAWNQPLVQDGIIPRQTYEVISSSAVEAWELCIDSLAGVFAVTLPYIDWDAKPDKNWIPKSKADEFHLVSRMWDQAGHVAPSN